MRFELLDRVRLDRDVVVDGAPLLPVLVAVPVAYVFVVAPLLSLLFLFHGPAHDALLEREGVGSGAAAAEAAHLPLVLVPVAVVLERGRRLGEVSAIGRVIRSKWGRSKKYERERERSGECT